MSILDRFSDIVSSNVNALLDKMEDPSKMVDQYLRNAMDDLADVKKETAGVMAETKRCERLVNDAKAEVEKYDSLARKALSANNEDDARVFIAEKQKAEAELSAALPTLEAARGNERKIRQMYDKLKADVESLQARRNNLKAMDAVAKTNERLNKVTSNMGGRGSVEAFDRMEAKITKRLDRAEAMAELSQGGDDEVRELTKKYGSGSSATVDDELARMKAEMGMGAPSGTQE